MADAIPTFFPYDRDKAQSAMLWFIQRHGGTIDKLMLVKLLFLADRDHMAKYGRPIIGGKYVAMKHGPVTSPALNQINDSADIEKVDKYTVASRVAPRLEELSESDVEVMVEIDGLYGQMPVAKLYVLVHELRSYSKHYPDQTENTSRPIPIEDLFADVDDASMQEAVEDNLQAIRLLQSLGG